MGYTLAFIAGLVAVIWLAAILLVIRDKHYGYPVTFASKHLSAESACPEPDSPGPPPLPRWREMLLMPFGLLVVIVVIVLLAPLAIANGSYYFYRWLKFKILGVPLPVPGLPHGMELSDIGAFEPDVRNPPESE